MSKGNVALPALGIVIVAYRSELYLPKLIKTLVKAKQTGDYYILIDNDKHHKSAAIAEESKVFDKVIRSENHGFGASCNYAASFIPRSIGLLLFLNPDAIPEPGALSEMRLKAEPEWSAWMGLILLPDGTINTAGNLVHYSGLSYCGDLYQPQEKSMKPKELHALSGACLCIRRKAWDIIGGFEEVYFMYYEDTDLSFRLHRAGMRIGLLPSAKFKHEYIFNKGNQKWLYLERNRYIFMASHWPIKVLLLLLPYLLCLEIGLTLIAFKQGRLLSRMKGQLFFIMILPQVYRIRRRLNETQVHTYDFWQHLESKLESSVIGTSLPVKVLSRFSVYYYTLAYKLLMLNRKD